MGFIWFYERFSWLGARITSIFMRVFYGIVVFYVGSTQYNHHLGKVCNTFLLPVYANLGESVSHWVYHVILYQLSTINCFSGCTLVSVRFGGYALELFPIQQSDLTYVHPLKRTWNPKLAICDRNIFF